MNGMNPQDQLNTPWNGSPVPEKPAQPISQQPAQPVQPDQPVYPNPQNGMPGQTGQTVPPAQQSPQNGMPVYAPARPNPYAPGAPAGGSAAGSGQPRPVYAAPYAGGHPGYMTPSALPNVTGAQQTAASPSAAPQPNEPSGIRPSEPASAVHDKRTVGFNEREQPRRRTGRWAAICALVLACILGGGAAGGFLVMRVMRSQEPAADTAVYAEPSAPSASDSDIQRLASASGNAGALSVEDIAAKAAPSVVAISTESRVQDMFGRVGYAEGAGSGVIMMSNGYIVTNHHVVNGARSISVTLATGDQYDAELIGSDASNDIAVIKIQAEDLPAIEVASSSELKLGSTVVAIGNPLGVLEGTVTDGIISATSRNIQTEEGVMYNVLQTNAAINQGNSGGALVNNRGQLVGINSNKATGNSVEGIAFAIPSDTVMPLVNQLIENGEVRSPEVGIIAASITADMQQAYKLPAGIYVQSVKESSPAEKAGLKERDIITEVDGQGIGTVQDFTALKNRHQSGDTMKLTVWRSGETVSLDVVLEQTGAAGSN